MLNFCANNYLGLANDPRIVAAAHRGLDEWGYGLASVRFICGTQEQHLELERRVSEFLGYDDTILFSSCFDANGGVFEMLFGPEDAIISDELNHASIIDGIRLSKAQRFRYKNRDMADLEAQLVAASDARRRVIVTDGVFSMDGYIAPLARDLRPRRPVRRARVRRRLARRRLRRRARPRAPPSYCGVEGRVDITPARSARRSAAHPAATWRPAPEIVDLLRQRARPYLFSNTLAPAIVAGTLRRSSCSSSRASCGSRLRRERRACSARSWRPRASTCCPASTRSCR